MSAPGPSPKLLQELRGELGAGWLLWVGLVCLGVLARLIWLDHLPGLNGDETWYGIQTFRLFHGLPLAWNMLPGSRPLFSPISFLSQFPPGFLGVASILWLRAPTVLASLLSLVLVYRWKSWLGRREALMLTLLLAVAPAQICYARFGWDPSLTPFLLILLISASRRQLAWGLAGGLLGMATHPFFVYALPVGVLLWVCRVRPQWTQRLVLGTLVTCLALLTLPLPSPIGEIEAEWRDPLRFASGVVDLLDGESTFAYLVDREKAQLGGNVAAVVGVLLPLLMAFSAWQAARKGRTTLAAVGACALWIWAGHYNLLGTHTVIYQHDRNGLLMLVPIYLWAVAQGSAWTAKHPRWAWGLVFGLSLWLTWRDWDRYLLDLRWHGTRSHRAFLCAPRDPREEALELACQYLQPGCGIITDDHWNFYPLTYFGLPKNVVVLHISSVPDLKSALLQGWVVVAHSNLEVHQQVLGLGIPLRGQSLHQYGGMPVTEVLAHNPYQH